MKWEQKSKALNTRLKTLEIRKIPAAFSRRTEAGGVFKIKVKLLSCNQSKIQYSEGDHKISRKGCSGLTMTPILEQRTPSLKNNKYSFYTERERERDKA